MIASGYTTPKHLLSAMFTVIASDANVRNLFGGPLAQVRLYDTVAPPEPGLPYLVHTVQLGPASLEDTVTRGMYDISVYTLETGTSRLNEFIGVLLNLLNNQIFTSEEVAHMYFSLGEGARQVDTGNGNVKRYDLPFEVRYTI